MIRIRFIYLVGFFFCFPISGITQGVQWTKSLSWPELLKQAKIQKKYLFVDCFTSWCGPCKRMDKNVYSSDIIGKIVNESFVAIKVQMDSVTNCEECIESNNVIANMLKSEHNVSTYPTYLFFSPDGKITHRGLGYKEVEEFTFLLNQALDTNQQVYTLLEKYQNKTLQYKFMPSLAKGVTFLLGDKVKANKIAKDYFDNYLDKLTDENLLNKESLKFLTLYPTVLDSKNHFFKLFYNQSNKIDSILEDPGISKKILNSVVAREEIYSVVYPNKQWVKVEPDWESIQSAVQKKYNKRIAEENIINAKIAWYGHINDWNNRIRYQVKKIESDGIDTTVMGRFYLNNFIYEEILFHCKDMSILEKAIRWMEEVIKKEESKDPASIDTYANILYKYGRRSEAIKWQKKALAIDPNNEGLINTLSKMEANEPTWNK